MSDLAASLAALAESLEPAAVTDRTRTAPVVVDLTEILAMPLDQFACGGQLLEVRVPWHAETLWFVPDERDAEALLHDGVGRGRVWTARELIALMALPDRTPATVRSLALAKREVDGDLVNVGPREPRSPSGLAGSRRGPGSARGGQS